MAVILFFKRKGGTGATTVATNIAAMRAAAGRDVLLADLDPQASATFWASVRADRSFAPVPCVQKTGRNTARDLLDLSKRYQDIIIDTAGVGGSIETAAALTVADKAISTVQASQFDLWTIAALATDVQYAQARNPSLTAQVLITRALSNYKNKDAAEAGAYLGEYRDVLSLLPVTIKDRTAYRRAAAAGISVVEDGGDPKASAEMQALYDHIFPKE